MKADGDGEGGDIMVCGFCLTALKAMEHCLSE